MKKVPHNFIGLKKKDNNFRKGIFVDAYDEPTYLTFALDFHFDDYKIPEDTFDAACEYVLTQNSPLLSRGVDGAVNFLINRGFNPQANGLTSFASILRYLTFEAPWYFQSISGLNTLYEKATNQELGWKTEGLTLTVETLEAIDLRIHELAGLYRNAIFDNKFRRERVPDNLRWFSVDIYIAEFRNLRFRLPGVTQGAAQSLGINTATLGNIIGGGNIVSNVLDQFGYIKFSCRQCEFDFSKTVPFRNNISVNTDNRQFETNRFGIKVGWVDEEVKFGDGTKIFDDISKTDIKNPWGAKYIGATIQNIGSFLSGLPVIGEDIQNAGQKAADLLGQVGGLVNPALAAASKFIEPPIEDLGNAYKEPPARPAEPTGNAYSRSGGNKTAEPKGNAYGEPPTRPTEPTGNAFD